MSNVNFKIAIADALNKNTSNSLLNYYYDEKYDAIYKVLYLKKDKQSKGNWVILFDGDTMTLNLNSYLFIFDKYEMIKGGRRPMISTKNFTLKSFDE